MPDPTTQKDFIIRFKKGKVVDEALGLRLFQQSSQSGDIGEFDFTILKSASSNFHYKDQFEKFLTGKSTTLELAAHHKNVEIHSDLDKKEIIYKAKTTIIRNKATYTESLSIAFAEFILSVPDSNKNCGIDDSQDPGCRFIYGRKTCKSLIIDHNLSIISGTIAVDLYVSDSNKKKKNTFKVIITPYVGEKEKTKQKFDLNIIEDNAKWDSVSGRPDDKHEFNQEIEFSHNGEKNICYLVEIKWYDKDGFVASDRSGKKGYTRNQKFTIGNKGDLPKEMPKPKYHIEWI